MLSLKAGIGPLLKQKQVSYSSKKKTINSIFPRPKPQDRTDRPSSKMVYKIDCNGAILYTKAREEDH